MDKYETRKIYFNGTLVITDPCYIKNSFGACLMKRDTIYGDWACMAYKGNIEGNCLPEKWTEMYTKWFTDFGSNDKDEKRRILDEYNEKLSKWLKDYCFGEFCADGGEVGVFDYDKLSNGDKEWLANHKRCATVIDGFDGVVEFKVIDGEVHVIGSGNKPFFTVQSEF